MKHKINTATGTCSVCGLTTATGFTRECLGKPMHSLTMKAVSKGEIDYYDGSFHTKDETKEETIGDILQGIADKHGLKLVEVHTPRMQRANAESTTRDDYVPNRDGLEAYEAMEKFINDFMTQETKSKQEEYALSKDEIEFLKQVHDHPIPRKLVNELQLSQANFILLHSLKKAGYVYPAIDSSSWVVTNKAKAYLNSLSEPAPLVMNENALGMLVLLSELGQIDNEDIIDDKAGVAGADVLVGLELARNCGEHLHITIKGRIHITKLIEMKIN